MTRPSPARPGTTDRTRPAEPIPPTVWLCLPNTDTGVGPVPDADPTLGAVLAAIVSAFSAIGDHVGLLAWPAPGSASGDPSASARGKAAEDAAAVNLPPAAVTAAGRIPVPLHLTPTGALLSNRPHGPDRPGPAVTPPHSGSARAALPGTTAEGVGALRLELIVVMVAPEIVDEMSAGRVALAAARALRRGGVLVVLTHCDRHGGVLVDPGGVLVAAAQNADLLYLQHIVAVHAPIHDRRTHPGPATTPAGPSLGERPALHRRVHSDLYILVQQQAQPQPADDAPTTASMTAAVIPGADR